MKFFITSIMLGLLFIASSTLSAQDWQGTWDTSFGEVRLVQQGNKVYGDYKHVGYIDATISGNTLQGIFTNGTSKGSFNWKLDSKAFSGKWGWEQAPRNSNWTGTRKNSNKPKITSSIKSKIKPTTTVINAKSWTGTWNSSYGELRLIEKDGKVYGDYKNVGYIEASKKGNTITGVYTNGDSGGLIQFARSGGSFTGKWGPDEILELKQGKWSGDLKLTNDWKGTIKNTARPNVKHPHTKKLNSYEGRYRVTVTRLIPYTWDSGLFAIFNTSNEFYGTIGVRLKGKGSSGNVEIKSMGNKSPRVWSVSASNSRVIKDWSRDEEIDRIREYMIKGDLANKDLMVNIQASLSEEDGFADTKYPWKQRNLYVKDMVLGQEYFVTTQVGKEYFSVGYKVEKL